MKLRSSPWGRIQDQREIIPGIIEVSTSSHGGMHLSPGRLAELPAAVRNAQRFNSPGPWYEEDCEVFILFVAFPELAAALNIPAANAEKALRAWYSEIADDLALSPQL